MSGNKKAIYCPLVDSLIPKFFTRTSLQQRNLPMWVGTYTVLCAMRIRRLQNGLAILWACRNLWQFWDCRIAIRVTQFL